jgi:hypothetical protein
MVTIYGDRPMLGQYTFANGYNIGDGPMFGQYTFANGYIKVLESVCNSVCEQHWQKY